MKKNFIYVVSIFAIFIVIAMVQLNKKGTEKERTKVVAVSKVVRTNLSQMMTLSAELVPFTEATLYAKVPGYLKEIRVDIGDQVKAGEVLAILDVPELADILARDKATLVQAKLDFTRLTNISKKHPELIAQEDVDKITEAYRIAKANVRHAQTMYNYSIITAPFDGVITQRFVDEGAMIQQGTDTNTQAIPIVHVADNQKFRLTFPVPESSLSFVNPGDPVDVHILSTDKHVKASVSRIAKRVSTDTRTMETQVDVYNTAALNLAPGMYASVTFGLREKKNVLALPPQAVEMSSVPNAWCVNKNDEIQERSLTLGLQTPSMVEITGGLEDGDVCVFGNRSALSVGMKITPKLINAT